MEFVENSDKALAALEKRKHAGSNEVGVGSGVEVRVRGEGE